MSTVLIILAVIVGLFVLICLLALVAGVVDRLLHPHGHEASAQEIREQLQEIVDGRNRWALDDFTSSGSFKDPRFEAIRQRVEQLDVEFPRESPGEYCGPKGIEVIRGYIRELEHETAA
jgi:FPC/CPF motif-containing protein YcgG